jgi:murein DD-endopeptidase MepM/ murein hydrolase activator NlpD
MLYSNMLKLFIFAIISSSLYSCDTAKSMEVTPLMTSMHPITPVLIVNKGEVKRGQGLFQALKSVSIENSHALKLINELRDEIEFSKLKVGDQLEATFNQDKKLVKFTFSQNKFETHIVTFNELLNKWDYSLKTLETFWKPRMLEGELRSGSSLEQDLIAQGLKRSVVNEVVNVLLCKVNFRMNARQGDRYKVLLSERMHKNTVVGSKVLFTSYQGIRAGTHEAFLYEDEQKGSTYTAHYTESGQALISSGLRYPLSRLHVRSGYGWRRHPVTGKRAMHRGVDLRGRRGAKVHAVAAGKVVVSTFNKFAGNKIGIRHSDGSTSFYYHLSKRGVNVGSWVRSHQVIGRVGSTGRVTGAHLHFGFKKPNGKWMNPLNKRMIATPRLTGKRFLNLSKQVSMIKGTLADLQVSKETKYLVANFNSIQRYPSAYEKFSSYSEILPVQ